MAVANNAIRTNYIKVKIVSIQKNLKRDDRDDTIHHIISECRKLAQMKYNSKLEWVGKVMH